MERGYVVGVTHAVILYFDATSLSSSTLTFVNVTTFGRESCSQRDSKNGEMALQGAHQSAQTMDTLSV